MSFAQQYPSVRPHPEARVIITAHPPRASLAGLDADQRRAAYDDHRQRWLSARRDGIGASDASTLLGLNPYNSLLGLYADKTGGHRPAPHASARVGRDLEPAVLERFTEETGLSVRRVGLLARRDEAFMMATPDALTSNGGGVEAKTTTERGHGDQWDDHPADHAYVQAQWGMWVTGCAHWYVAVLFRDTGNFRVYRLVRDEALIGRAVERARTFWRSYVATGTEPPLHGGAAEAETARATAPGVVPGSTVEHGEVAASLGRRLGALKSAAKEIAAQVKAAETELVRLHGHHETVTAYGTPVSRFSAGQLAHARYAADHPEQAAQYMEWVRKINSGRAVAEDATARQYIARRLTLSGGAPVAVSDPSAIRAFADSGGI